MEQTAPNAPFYIVSTRKLWILYFATLGMYVVYWTYRHWQAQKERHPDELGDIWPAPRGLFCVFTLNRLFDRIEVALKARNAPVPWSGANSANLLVGLLVITAICDRLSSQDVGLPWTTVISFATLPLIAWSMAKPQEVINLVCGDERGATNDALSGANWAWIVFGAVLWMLALIGSIAPQ